MSILNAKRLLSGQPEAFINPIIHKLFDQHFKLLLFHIRKHVACKGIATANVTIEPTLRGTRLVSSLAQGRHYGNLKSSMFLL